MNKKICAFGMDGLIIPLMKKFVSEGYLPNFRRMLEEGTVNQTLPSFPVWTPTNWATLSTGANTGTHGASRWSVDIDSKERISSFNGRAVSAERIWTALERSRIKSVVIHYPAAYPSKVKSSTIIEGFAHPGYAHTDYEIAPSQAYTTKKVYHIIQKDHDGSPLRTKQLSTLSIPEPKTAERWANLVINDQSQPLETIIEISARENNNSNIFYMLIFCGNNSCYEQVRIYREKDIKTFVAEAKIGKWSKWVTEPFKINGETRLGSFRFKLLELSPDGKYLKLYRSQVTYASGFTFPKEKELPEKLIQKIGPFQEHASFVPYETEMVDFKTALEECEYQGIWMADVANYMLYEKNYSFFMCHWHLFDYINHIFLNHIDPACPDYNQNTAKKYKDYFLLAYQVADHILEKIWKPANKESYIGILADHGGFPDMRVANIRKFLYEKGFLVLKKGDGKKGIDEDWVKEEDIDWKKTRAYLKEAKGFDIYINAPIGAKFDKIEKELLANLRSWIDEETGDTPIAIALPKRDAYLLGQWGKQCGDIVFVWNHNYVSGYLAQWETIIGSSNVVGAPKVYGAHHGGFLPTENDISSTFGSFMLAGPNIKKNYVRPVKDFGYIHATDIVPTFCHIFNVSPPIHSQGAIVYDIFEGHNF